MNGFRLSVFVRHLALRNGFVTLVVLSLIISFSGCDNVPKGGPRVEVIPVTGKVLVDGEPGANVDILFIRVSDVTVDLTVPTPRGKTDENGVIQCSSYVTNDGITAGTYKLIFAMVDKMNPITGELEGDRFKGKYMKGSESEFTVTISEEPVDGPVDIGTFELSTE